MNLNLKGYDLLNSQSKRQCYIDWLNNSRNNMDLSNFNSMFPEFETIMSEQLASVKNFNQYLAECGILDDFDKYILIKDIDKLD